MIPPACCKAHSKGARSCSLPACLEMGMHGAADQRPHPLVQAKAVGELLTRNLMMN